MSVSVLAGVFQHLNGSLFSPEKAHSHLFRAGESPCWSPRTFLLYHCQARSPEIFYYPFSVVLHPPFFLPKIWAPLPAWPDPTSPQDSTVSVPPGPQAPTTHLPPPQHSPYTYHDRQEQRHPASMPASLQAPTRAAQHKPRYRQAFAPDDRGQESWGSFSTPSNECPCLLLTLKMPSLPHGPPGHLTPLLLPISLSSSSAHSHGCPGWARGSDTKQERGGEDTFNRAWPGGCRGCSLPVGLQCHARLTCATQHIFNPGCWALGTCRGQRQVPARESSQQPGTQTINKIINIKIIPVMKVP